MENSNYMSDELENTPPRNFLQKHEIHSPKGKVESELPQVEDHRKSGEKRPLQELAAEGNAYAFILTPLSNEQLRKKARARSQAIPQNSSFGYQHESASPSGAAHTKRGGSLPTKPSGIPQPRSIPSLVRGTIHQRTVHEVSGIVESGPAPKRRSARLNNTGHVSSPSVKRMTRPPRRSFLNLDKAVVANGKVSVPEVQKIRQPSRYGPGGSLIPLAASLQSDRRSRRTSSGHPLKLTIKGKASESSNGENDSETASQTSKEESLSSSKGRNTERNQSQRRIDGRRPMSVPRSRPQAARNTKERKSFVAFEGKTRVEQAFSKSFSALSDEELAKLTHLRLQGNKRWDLKGQVARYEDALKNMKNALTAVHDGRVKFKALCEDIEMSFQKDLLEQKKRTTELEEQNQKLQAEFKLFKQSYSGQSKESSELLRKIEMLMIDKQRMSEDLIKSQAEIEKANSRQAELQLMAARAEGRASEISSQMAKNQDELKTLQSQQLISATETESQWRERLDKETSSLKEEVANFRAKLESKSAEIARGEKVRRELETRLVEMSNEVLKAESTAKDGAATRERAVVEAEHLRTELSAARSSLEQKSRELTLALESFAGIQKTGFQREDDMRSTIRELEDRCRNLEEGRLALKEELSKLSADGAAHQSVHTNLKEQIAQLTKERDLARENCSSVQVELTASKEQLAVEQKLRERAENREHEERTERTACTAQLMAMQSAHAADQERLKREQKELGASLEARIKELEENERRLQIDLKSKSEMALQMQSEVGILRSAVEEASSQMSTEQLEEMGRLVGENSVLKARLEEVQVSRAATTSALEKKLFELEEAVREGELKRRKMHNQIQELRGNIRVFVRVRPYLPNDHVSDGTPTAPEAKVDGVGLLIRKMDDSNAVVEQQSFNFDKVFSPSTGQEEVFYEVAEFVQSALDGYNVCLFSYGQTGSGKTHTMQGSGQGPMRGIIPRAMEQVGAYKTELQAQGWVYEMQVSFLEIYNETINDLLWPLASDPEASQDKKREIKRNAAGELYVTDLTQVVVDPSNTDQMNEIMEIAARHRSVGSTDMNAQSSRSHSVFTLHLRATNAEKGCAITGKLNLVDLAGSERLSRSGATGDRLKEAQAINKSLSCLTDVFSAIAKKNPHVPFRNSKLTYLLQPALSGEGKTLMMVNLSPTQESYFESLSSLRFGKSVNQCELGKAKRHFEDLPPTEEMDSGPNSPSTLGPKKSASVAALQVSTHPKRTDVAPRSSSHQRSVHGKR